MVHRGSISCVVVVFVSSVIRVIIGREVGVLRVVHEVGIGFVLGVGVDFVLIIV